MVGTRMERITSRLERALSARRTRIGTRCEPSLNLATLASMSPMVATRATEAMVSIETPRRAAWSGLGRMTISGPTGGLDGTTLASIGRVCIWRCSSSAVFSSRGPLSLVRVTVTPPPPKPPESKVTWASGTVISNGRTMSLILVTGGRSSRDFSTTVTVPWFTAEEPPPKKPPPEVEPTVAKTWSVSERVATRAVTFLTKLSMSAGVAPGGPCMSM